MTTRILSSDESPLCVCCATHDWTVTKDAIYQGLDWSNIQKWNAQEFPFSLSGQRTLVVQCRSNLVPSNWSIKIKGHHLSLFKPTAADFVFEYRQIRRPSNRPYSSLRSVGPRLATGHYANSGWWANRLSVSSAMEIRYQAPENDAPAGAMLLADAIRELEMLNEAHALGKTPLVPIAYGRYPISFEEYPTGFNVVAGPIGRDFRANGLFKGAIVCADRQPLYMPISRVRNYLRKFFGAAEDHYMAQDEPDCLRILWQTVAKSLGKCLRSLHLTGIYHGAADFGNLVVTDVRENEIEVALVDWEESAFLPAVAGFDGQALLIEDLLYPTHALILESINNKFFSSVTSAAEMTEAILQGYAHTTADLGETANEVCSLVSRIMGGKRRKDGTPVPVALVDLIFGRRE